jgi:hypothetical protein
MANLVRSLVVVIAYLASSYTVASAQSASAEPNLDQALAQAAMEDYFAGEKRGALLLGGMGLTGLVMGGFLFRRSSSVAKGASYPLLGIGLLHLAAGVFVYVASDKRIDDFTAAIDKDPQAFTATEHERMVKVQKTFTTLKIVEMVLIVGGGAAALVGQKTDRKRLVGIGLALSLEAALTLGFDFIAADRAGDYVDSLAGFQVSLAPSPRGDVSGLVLWHSRRF